MIITVVGGLALALVLWILSKLRQGRRVLGWLLRPLDDRLGRPRVVRTLPRPASPAAPQPAPVLRPKEMSLGYGSDVKVSITQVNWFPIGDKQTLALTVQVHNTNQQWVRIIKQHRFWFASGLPPVHRAELNLEGRGATWVLGSLQPGEVYRGVVSCVLPATNMPPDFEFFIQDDLGQETKATMNLRTDIFSHGETGTDS